MRGQSQTTLHRCECYAPTFDDNELTHCGVCVCVCDTPSQSPQTAVASAPYIRCATVSTSQDVFLVALARCPRSALSLRPPHSRFVPGPSYHSPAHPRLLLHATHPLAAPQHFPLDLARSSSSSSSNRGAMVSFSRLVEQATAESLLESDWALNLQITDLVRPLHNTALTTFTALHTCTALHCLHALTQPPDHRSRTSAAQHNTALHTCAPLHTCTALYTCTALHTCTVLRTCTALYTCTALHTCTVLRTCTALYTCTALHALHALTRLSDLTALRCAAHLHCTALHCLHSLARRR
jgi:hypothetical protein